MTTVPTRTEVNDPPAKPAEQPRLIKKTGSTATVDAKAAGKAFGSSDSDFITGFVHHLINLGTPGKGIDEEGTAYVTSLVRGIQPRDQVEAMLASQMAAVHLATMTFARRLAHVETIPQQDSAERALNKLARTFATQMEALKRYRTGGEQKMTVEHVHVHDGGQAIVGNVNAGGRGDGKI